MGQSHTPHRTFHIYHQLFSCSAQDSPAGVWLVFCKISRVCSGYGAHWQNIEAPVPVQVLISEISTANDGGFCRRFLNNIIVPHLEEFSLSHYYNLSIEVIASFLRRSTLRSLSMNFSGTPPHYEDFMRLLQSMPSLNRLSLISGIEKFVSHQRSPATRSRLIANDPIFSQMPLKCLASSQISHYATDIRELKHLFFNYY